MKSKIDGLIICLCLICGFLVWHGLQGSFKKQVEAHPTLQAVLPAHAENGKNFVKETVPSAPVILPGAAKNLPVKLAKKININLKILLRNNPGLASLNPGIDFKSMSTDDPRLAQIRIPRETKLLAMKDPNCSSAGLADLGKMGDSALQDVTDRARMPSFASVATDQETTLGSLSQSVDGNPCILGLFANGSLESAAIPNNVTDVQSLVAPGDPAPAVFNLQALMKDGSQVLRDKATKGDNSKIQVYMVGSTAEGAAVGADPTQVTEVSGTAAPPDTTQVFNLPMPSGDSGEQIASLNNSIMLSVSKGAKYVLAPFIDPSAIQGAVAYANAHGAQVVIVPNKTEGRAPSSGR